MPGMSPRMKAKKGRFLNYGQPTVITISSPAAGAVSLTVQAAGTAIDPESGNISARLVWTSDKDGQVGTGASPMLTLTANTHLITAKIPGETPDDTVIVTAS